MLLNTVIVFDALEHANIRPYESEYRQSIDAFFSINAPYFAEMIFCECHAGNQIQSTLSCAFANKTMMK